MKEIKLYVTCNNSDLRGINRIIRNSESAERAIADLRSRLAGTAAGKKDPGQFFYAAAYLRLRISYRVGNSPFLATKVYWIGNKVDCAKAVDNLNDELHRLLAESCGVNRYPSPEIGHISTKDLPDLEWISRVRRMVESLTGVDAWPAAIAGAV